MNKLYVSWEYIEKAAIAIAKYAIENDIQYITGIPRGGLIPATLISHYSNIPFKEFLSVDSNPSRVLLIDDISDTGDTLKQITDQLKYKTATIHYKLTSKFTPDFYYEVAEENIWQCYPWELKESKTKKDN